MDEIPKIYRQSVLRACSESFAKEAQMPPYAQNTQNQGPTMGREVGFLAGGAVTGGVLGGLEGRRIKKNILSQAAKAGPSTLANVRGSRALSRVPKFMGGMGILGGLALGHFANKAY